MTELIKIREENGLQAVSAKELYLFLEINTEFAKWCSRMIEYGFLEGKDFSSFLTESTGGRPLTDYALTLDTAKHWAMMQRTDKGMQARSYFIECEKKLVSLANQFSVPKTLSEALRLAADQADQIESQKKIIEVQKPKAIFADAVTASDNSILIGELSKILKRNGVDIGQNRLFEKLRNEGYLMKRGEMRNQPTQKSMELKLFEIKKRTINNPDGSVRVTSTTVVTGVGQVYFVNKFLKNGSCASLF